MGSVTMLKTGEEIKPVMSDEQDQIISALRGAATGIGEALNGGGMVGNEAECLLKQLIIRLEESFQQH